MFKNINNILCIFLMLNLIGYIYAGSQDTCKGQLGHAGFIVHDDNGKKKNGDKSFINTQIKTWKYPPNDLPYAYSAYDHLKNFIVQFKKKNKKMPMEYCESLDNK
ncbi:uncharacterized protein LOC107883948 isoform X1 [Acyrthosiphon pisum]|uniref:Uncharacterized protein n=1 Tax=Acyrthosiphon pisum TaxID=7029 RepID=A0A8R2D4R3_ACYPI|nr:uncharacterized protein LOC107883948 isoform X1 [Acyrthosiphon pisum]|eukprot:XP_016660528.1 PREDICTED: uncharacterized protein LOC107883948 isoform X4 [Acyrthosiphon pisum]